MYDLILLLEGDIVWRYRDIVCKAYPLADIDTINEETAHLNQNSVLANLAYGDKESHLEFFDGLIDELLQRKWETFGRQRLFTSLFAYLLLLASFYAAFMTREIEPAKYKLDLNGYSNESVSSISPAEMNELQQMAQSCHRWRYGNSTSEQIRFVSELLTVLCVVVHAARITVDVQNSGYWIYWETIRSFPEKILQKIALALVILMVPVRFACVLHPSTAVFEDILAIAAVMMTTTHCLFYCRGLKFVGPFVLMVYKIILQDMSRFLLIYSVFLACFSQAFSVVFRACERAELDYVKTYNINVAEEYPNKFVNIMDTPTASLMRMFIMSVGEFTAFYKNLNDCKCWLAILGKILFIVYELLVSVMLLNLLIAMMTRTYEKIAEAQKEWKRQWAKVILMLEQSLTARSRRLAMYGYSRPLRSDIRQRAFVVLEKGQGATHEVHAEHTRKRPSMMRLSPHLHVGRGSKF